MYIKSLIQSDRVSFINTRRTRTIENIWLEYIEWKFVCVCVRERERGGKQILSDFVNERKNRKQALLWKC